MNPIDINIAIAKACGWTNIDKYFGRAPIPFTRSFLGGTDDGLAEGEDTLGHEIKPIPDYCNDLNAMHEAEKTLEIVSLGLYLRILADKFPYNGGYSWTFGYAKSITATSAQRAEAFLRALNLWTE